MLELLLLTGVAFAQGAVFPAMQHLDDDETFRAAKLTSEEMQQIFDQTEKTSFDFPQSWEAELRVRRFPLGAAEGLVVQGTKLLCGATGNCQTWVFRRSQGKWISMFEKQAPIVSGFGFEQETRNRIKNFVAASNTSAEIGRYSVFHFDGKFYIESQCYVLANRANTKASAEEIPCK